MNIKEYLNKIIGHKVTSCSAGGAVGSIIRFELTNNYSFMIYCSWRLEQNEIVISTSTDSIFPKTGLITKSTPLLNGREVISIILSEQYDLTIYFEDNFCLKVFCDISYTNEISDYNWDLAIPDENRVFVIKNDFKIKIENYW